MNKKNLYIVFDQLPSKKTGGLVTTYVSLFNLLKDQYNIKIISVFEYENNELFDEKDIICVNRHIVSSDCVNILTYIKKFDLKKTIISLKQLFLYFLCIPFNKKKIAKIIDNNDLVIVSSPSAAIFMPKNLDFILEIHTYFKYFFDNNLKGKLQSLLMQKPKLMLFRTKNDMREVRRLGFENIGYVYNFFDNVNTKLNKNTIKNKICFVGRLEEAKNLPRMMDIAIELKKYDNDYILDIYGEGSYKELISKLIYEYELQDNVFLKGFTDDKNIYGNYSLMWMTSNKEGLSLSVIEAKACGIPTISTNWGEGVYEVIEDGIDGFVAKDNSDFVDKTMILLSNNDKLKIFRKNCLKNFEKFSKENARKTWIYILNNYKNKNLDSFFDK